VANSVIQKALKKVSVSVQCPASGWIQVPLPSEITIDRIRQVVKTNSTGSYAGILWWISNSALWIVRFNTSGTNFIINSTADTTYLDIFYE
jgi:hypothetical protein